MNQQEYILIHSIYSDSTHYTVNCNQMESERQ